MIHDDKLSSLSRTYGLNTEQFGLSYNLINLYHLDTMPYLADGSWVSPYYSSPYYYSRYASPYWTSAYDPYWRYDSPYTSPYWRSRYYDSPYYSRYYDSPSYSAYLDAKYGVPALAPSSTVTYSSPTKTEIVTESPGKREVTTYDYSPSTRYSTPVRRSYVDYDYYSPYWRSRSYVSPYTGSLIWY